MKILVKCEVGPKIHIDCMDALKAVEEISRLTLDNARVIGNMSEPATGHGWQVGGHRGHGDRQSGQHHTPTHDRTMEEASQSVDEMCLNTGYDMGCDVTSLLPSVSHDDVGPSHRFAHGDTSQSPSMVYDDTCPPTSSTTSPLPTTRTSPLPTTGTTPTNVETR